MQCENIKLHEAFHNNTPCFTEKKNIHRQCALYHEFQQQSDTPSRVVIGNIHDAELCLD